MLVLGFASGLPLALSGSTLQAWLTVEGVDVKAIGMFSLVGWPYLVKFLWAPLMDRYVPPLLGRRRGWLLLMQFALAGLLVALALTQPSGQTAWIGLLAVMLATCSASQDIAGDAYRTDVLAPRERGLGVALWGGGYRLAMLMAGPVALVIAGQWGFSIAYLVMAGLMVPGVLATLFAPDPERPPKPPATLLDAVVEPLSEFVSRRAALLILVSIVLYKIGDAFALSLSTTFLIRGLGFTVTEVGAISKTTVVIATIAGTFVGGGLLVKLGLYRSLLWFGILQTLTNLGFAWLAWHGKSYLGMALALAFDNFAGGMGTAALMAWLMALCDARYSAFQFALLSAVSAVGRVLIGPVAGAIAASHGWVVFFLSSFFAALPGIALIVYLGDVLRQLEFVPKSESAAE